MTLFSVVIMDEVLLCNKFVLYPSAAEAEVTLSNTTLSILTHSKDLETIDVKSIIGEANALKFFLK